MTFLAACGRYVLENSTEKSKYFVLKNLGDLVITVSTKLPESRVSLWRCRPLMTGPARRAQGFLPGEVSSVLGAVS